MPRVLSRPTLLFLIGCAVSVSASRAETIKDSQLEFTLRLSDEFTVRPELVAGTPDVVHAFQYGEAAENEMPVLLIIERMGGVLGRDRVDPQDLPPGFAGTHFVTSWKGFQLDGFRIPESLNELDIITYNVQVPLKPEAIQLKFAASADQEELLQRLMSEVLAGLDGESNWLASVTPPTVGASKTYTTVLMALGLASVLGGLVGFWLISRFAPRGSVLMIAAILYGISWPLGSVPIREVRLLCGCLRMLGFIGLILGILDILRKRKAHAPSGGVVDAEIVDET